MKKQAAINVINSAYETLFALKTTPAFDMAMVMAIAALEKQVPKKPSVGADFLEGHDNNGVPVWIHDYLCAECG